MAFTHNLLIGWSSGSNSIQHSRTGTGGAENNISESIATGTTDGLVAYELDVSQIQTFYMVSDFAITVETNDGSTPDDTFNLTQNAPIIYYSGMGIAISDIFSADITALYVTNSSGNTATLEIRCVFDPTV